MTFDFVTRTAAVNAVELAEALSALDASLARGIADDEAGRVKTAAQVLDRLAVKYAAIALRGATDYEKLLFPEV